MNETCLSVATCARAVRADTWKSDERMLTYSRIDYILSISFVTVMSWDHSRNDGCG
jgi:hypothetical protein